MGTGTTWTPSLTKRLEARQDDQAEQIRIIGEFVDDMYSSLNRRLDTIQNDQATGFASVRLDQQQLRAEIKEDVTSLRRAFIAGTSALIVALIGTIITLLALVGN